MGVLEGKMTSDEVSRARTEASRWRPSSSSQPSPTPPRADASRSASAPEQQTSSPAATAQPPARASANSDDLDGTTNNISKSDIDGLLDQVPQGLRKKLGF
jgi:hypothetical protein